MADKIVIKLSYLLLCNTNAKIVLNYNVRNVIAAYLKAHQLKLESAKKFANLKKLIFFIAKSSYIVKMFAKKNLSKKIKNYTFFEKPLTM